ncbi:acyl carrier protein [Segniliparus rugosus]|uniref:Acyl carrier protein n=1 Tax=Segniliparus rugosus (strain ATCC BAA-974 / DSM 45345 / CCUG 50838 / CIP 108380 / JCM 13579 / CDC 945) TaxID=679197 RepID=E5XN09_SEGRC|nr:phosphopantetheine-binding protein [Segniliparus rugosus]EFV14267.1 acyl carrier protein [Segniliparus rugosus ATCC BAA-974]
MQDPDHVRTRVYNLVGRLSPEGPKEILPTDRIIDDLGYHSVKVVELVIEIELEFNLPPFSEADTAGVETVDDIVQLVEKRIATRAL